jgi:hypothetical protein
MEQESKIIINEDNFRLEIKKLDSLTRKFLDLWYESISGKKETAEKVPVEEVAPRKQIHGFDRSTEALSYVIMKKADKEFTIKDVMEAITEYYMIHNKKLKKISLENYCYNCLRELKRKGVIIEVAKGAYKKAAVEGEVPLPDKSDVTEKLNSIAKDLQGKRSRKRHRMENIHGRKLGKKYGVRIYEKPIKDLLALGDRIANSSDVQEVIRKHFQIKSASVPQYCSAHRKFLEENPNIVEDLDSNGNPSVLLNWMEEHIKIGTGFDINDFMSQCKVTREEAQKMVARCIDKNKIQQMDSTTFKRV